MMVLNWCIVFRRDLRLTLRLISSFLVPVGLLRQWTDPSTQLLLINPLIIKAQLSPNSRGIMEAKGHWSFVVSSVVWIKEVSKGISNILPQLSDLLPSLVESIANVLTEVGKRLTDILAKLTDLLEEIGGLLRRWKLIGYGVGDLAGD